MSFKIGFTAETERKEQTYEILLIQNGISLSLTKLLLEKYRRYIRFNIEDDTIELDIELIDEMSKNKENQILIFEAENNIIRK